MARLVGAVRRWPRRGTTARRASGGHSWQPAGSATPVLRPPRQWRRAMSPASAIQPCSEETGWHWHDMNAHFVYALKGWIRFRFDGADEAVTVVAGSCLSQLQRTESFICLREGHGVGGFAFSPYPFQ